MTMKYRRRKSIVISCLVVFYFLVTLLFAYRFLVPEGFAQTSSSSSSSSSVISSNESEISISQTFKLKQYCQTKVKPVYDKLVFVLIDAFRADFIPYLRSHVNHDQSKLDYDLPFLNQLIQNGCAVSAVAQARTPTVTMPRLKALLSGTSSGFFDLLGNLNSKSLNDDNLVSQAYLSGRRLVFYGDDTWLQLFDKHMFVRHNQTDSFFATDYTSVDTNVTENLLPELDRIDEWDMLFAHYLGVDHIGHSWGGVKSNLMQAKLLEMDNVIQQIVTKLTHHGDGSDVLIAIVGDHGMTEAGNHGGNTDAETNTGAVFISLSNYVKCNPNARSHMKPEMIDQNDVSILLSSLLALSIPNRSQGHFKHRLFDYLARNKRDALDIKLCYQLYNGQQLKTQQPQIASTFQHWFTNATDDHWRSIGTHSNDSRFKHQATYSYEQFLQAMQSVQAEVKSEHLDLFTLCFCVLIQFAIWIMIIAFTYDALLSVPVMCWLSFVRVHMFNITYMCSMSNALFAFMISCFVLQALLLSSTSFIENEHLYCLLIASTCVILWLHWRGHRWYDSSSLKVLTLILFINHWTVHGRSNMVVHWNLNQNNLALLLMSSFATIAVIINVCIHTDHLFERITWSVFAVICMINRYVLLIMQMPLHWLARLAYTCIALIVVYRWTSSSSHHSSRPSRLLFACHILLAVLVLLQRPVHLPLTCVHMLLESCLARILFPSRHTNHTHVPHDDVISISLLYLCLAQSAFYSSGNTNSVSTLDVGPGFTGLSQYNLPLVCVQVLANTYGLFVFWICMFFVRTAILSSPPRALIITNFYLLRAFTLIIYQVVCITLRNHLFIWSVICPKYVYELMQTFIHSILFFVFNRT